MGVNISILQGRVTTRQEVFDKLASLVNTGVIGTIVIDPDTAAGVLNRVLVRRTVGNTLESFTVSIFDDVSKSLDNLVFEATAEGQDRMDVIRSELARFSNPNSKQLFIEVKTTTAGHSFQIRLQGDKTRT